MGFSYKLISQLTIGVWHTNPEGLFSRAGLKTTWGNVGFRTKFLSPVCNSIRAKVYKVLSALENLF
jgi:hypothetical protein